MSPRSSLRTSLTGAGQVMLGLALLAALLAGLDLAPATPSSAGSADPRPGPHTDPYTDGVADYGACRGTDPSCYNDRDLPREDDRRVRVLPPTATAPHAH